MMILSEDFYFAGDALSPFSLGLEDFSTPRSKDPVQKWKENAIRLMPS